MKKQLDFIGYYCLRGFSLILRRLPPRAAIGFGRCLGEFSYYVTSPRRKSFAYAEIKAVFGSRFSERERWRLVRRQYGYLGELFADLLCVPNLTKASMARDIILPHGSRYVKTLAERKGVIVLTGHLGNWEMSQLVSNVYYDRPVHVIAAAQKHNRMNDFLNSLRCCHGSSVITRGEGMGMRAIFRALRENKSTGILSDRDAGKKGGIIISLFGRKTTLPTGAFEVALKTGAPLFPCFLMRVDGPKHYYVMEEPIWCRQTDNAAENQKEIERGVLRFVEHLEKVITEFPDQWLWGVKRWKYTWTKRLLIIDSGRPGTLAAAEKVTAAFRKIDTQYARAGMEYPTQTIRVKFKSAAHEKLFSRLAPLFIPFAQGRLSWLKFFFTPETQKAIEESSADFVISADAALAPLALCLANDSLAKKIFTAKPAFPFDRYAYDLTALTEADLDPERLRKIL